MAAAAPGRSPLDVLRPHPHRGDLIAAGAVALAVAIYLVNFRMDDWGAGVHLVIAGAAALLVLAMGLLARLEEEWPRAYHTALLVAGLALALVALVRVADVLLGDSDGSSGTAMWVLALFAAIAAYPAVRLNSPICALIAAMALGGAVLFGVDEVFDPDGVSTFRWILLLLMIGYVVAALQLRPLRPGHSVHMVNAAGLAALGLAGTLASFFIIDFTEGEGAPFGWELVLLAVGFGLVAYAAVERAAGPGYLGAAVLFAFTIVAGVVTDDDASLIGWPIVLLLAALAALAAGLRPRQELPPEPPFPGAGVREPREPTPVSPGGAESLAPPGGVTTERVEPPTERVEPPTDRVEPPTERFDPAADDDPGPTPDDEPGPPSAPLRP